MFVYKNYETFDVLGEKINIFSTENEYGLNTVIEFGDAHFGEGFYYHIGNKPVNIESALSGWQSFYQTPLSKDEYEFILNDNSLSNIINTSGELNGNEESISKETSSSKETCQETSSKETCEKSGC
jgi:hypothetical protein